MTKEELRKSLDFVNEERERLQRENERLNNNWNRLKEYLENEWLEWKDVNDEWTRGQAIEDKHILDFIKELENE